MVPLVCFHVVRLHFMFAGLTLSVMPSLSQLVFCHLFMCVDLFQLLFKLILSAAKCFFYHSFPPVILSTKYLTIWGKQSHQ